MDYKVLQVYTIQPKAPRWYRKHQAEWEGCEFAPRGWTGNQVIQRAIGWQEVETGKGSLYWKIDRHVEKTWWSIRKAMK